MSSTRPDPAECPAYYFTYIDQVPDGDVLDYLIAQSVEAGRLLDAVTEEQSLYRYSAGKWSLREVLAHLNDCERLFMSRAFWFARGQGGELPSFDQDIANLQAAADARSWANHLAEFRAVRTSTLTLVSGMPDEAWLKAGRASGYPFTVRSLVWMAAGHVTHHLRLVRERYLS